MKTTDAAIPAIVGDHVPAQLRHVYIASSGRAPNPKVTHVQASCGSPTGSGYWCLSCREFVANDGQLGMHLERGKHVIAKACEIHGVEVAAP